MDMILLVWIEVIEHVDSHSRHFSAAGGGRPEDLKDVCSAPSQAEKLQRSFKNFLRLSRGESRL
jgi:hypothetical protein